MEKNDVILALFKYANILKKEMEVEWNTEIFRRKSYELTAIQTIIENIIECKGVPIKIIEDFYRRTEQEWTSNYVYSIAVAHDTALMAWEIASALYER